MFDQLRVRLRGLLQREATEAELDEELLSHLTREIDRNRARGMTVRDATAMARRALGNLGTEKERARETLTWRSLDEVARDLRFAGRTLRRRPMFAAVAIATMALGIGAATSIYSVIDGVLLRPLPFRDPAQLVAIWQTNAAWKKDALLAHEWDHAPLSMPQYLDLRAQQSVFEDVAVWLPMSATLIDGDHPEILRAIAISPSLLPLLGVRPALGRNFTSDEATPTGARVAMISYDAWVSRYGGSTDVLNRVIRFQDAPRVIVGVLPARFTLDRTMQPGAERQGQLGAPEFWMPVGQDSTGYFARAAVNLRALARMKPGVALERATDEADRLLHPATVQNPTPFNGTRVAPWQADETRDVRAPLLLCFAAVGMLLMIASLNMATLLLGEGVTREREMAVRVSLGASRARLMRQLLVESVMLTGLGAIVGLVLAWWGIRALVGLAPAGIPGLADVHVDPRVLVFAIVVTVVTGVTVGFAPALTLSGSASSSLVRAGMGHSVRARGGLQRVFIAMELALCVVLLVGAGLLVRTFERITQVDPGFRTDHLLVVRAVLPTAAAHDSIAIRAFYDATLVRLSALPGVTAVTAGSQPPFVGGPSQSPFNLEGEGVPLAGGGVPPEARRYWHWVQQRIVVPGYFPTLGIPLIAGREFSFEDRPDAEKVAIVSETVVRRDFDGRVPLGKRVYFFGAWRTIVGVVGDVHFAHLSTDVEPTLYTPATQQRVFSMPFFVRTVADPAAMTGSVRGTIAAIEPMAVVTTADVMTEAVKRSFAEQRYRAVLIALFGVLALLLAVVGIYGVATRAVQRRKREAAIRVALGATQHSIHWMLLRTTLGGVAVGLIIGSFGAFAVTRLLTPYLFGVSAKDPTTFAAVSVLLTAVSIVASWLPARTAGELRLTELLRNE